MRRRPPGPAPRQGVRISGDAQLISEHDAGGNLTYDGLHQYAYDAWNRLVKVTRAYPDADGDEDNDCETGSDVAIIRYDALGRRISKEIVNSADWNCTYHYYYDGQRMIETRNASDQVLKQHVWGLTYVDELVQIGINQDPENASTGTYTENLCERFFWPLQDANFNVIGVVNHAGLLVERYEYTPYGQRTVFSRDYLLCDINGDGAVDFFDDVLFWYAYTWPDHPFDFDGDGFVEKEEGQDDRLILQADKDAAPSSAADDLVCYPRLESCRGWSSSALIPLAVGLCDVGHQGLHLDKEFGLYDNRARYYHPRIGRFCQRDPGGYTDGMNRYEYGMSSPLAFTDPGGEKVVRVFRPWRFLGENEKPGSVAVRKGKLVGTTTYTTWGKKLSPWGPWYHGVRIQWTVYTYERTGTSTIRAVFYREEADVDCATCQCQLYDVVGIAETVGEWKQQIRVRLNDTEIANIRTMQQQKAAADQATLVLGGGALIAGGVALTGNVPSAAVGLAEGCLGLVTTIDSTLIQRRLEKAANSKYLKHVDYGDKFLTSKMPYSDEGHTFTKKKKGKQFRCSKDLIEAAGCGR